MCFIKVIYKSSPRLEARIATRPIRVLKVGRVISSEFAKKGFASVIYPKFYVPGKIETLLHPIIPKIQKSDYGLEYYLTIERGFHSYRSIYANYLHLNYIDLSQEEDWNLHINPHSIGIFEIPTGSIYYSYKNLFVSDTIKLIEVITSAQEWKEANFKPELIL